MDTAITHILTNLAHRWTLFDVLAIFFANYLQYLLVAYVLVISFVWRYFNRSAAIMAVIAALFSRFVLTSAIRFFIHRPRPFVHLQITPLIHTDLSEYFNSFPSGHAAFFFAFATAVYFYNKRLGNWLFLGAGLMGIARIFAGVHWFSDIVGGAVVGIVGAWLVQRYWPQISKALRLEKYA
ncbi:MAG TPA: phosphatase PAP2 family protein [Candidatus Paceibacterota bacterium]|nr:phosphatase PAP2 family protein [Candidatus Paceibacterota bacterium]